MRVQRCDQQKQQRPLLPTRLLTPSSSSSAFAKITNSVCREFCNFIQRRAVWEERSDGSISSDRSFRARCCFQVNCCSVQIYSYFDSKTQFNYFGLTLGSTIRYQKARLNYSRILFYKISQLQSSDLDIFINSASLEVANEAKQIRSNSN